VTAPEPGPGGSPEPRPAARPPRWVTEEEPAGRAGEDDDTVVLGVATVPPAPEPRQAPPVDTEELAAPQPRPVEPSPRGHGRVAPLQARPSRITARYLFPSESFRGEWRLHPIHIATPITVAVVATIGLGALAGAAEAYLAPSATGAGWVTPLVVLAWLGILAWAGLQIAFWHFYRFILTNRRVVVVEGIIARHVAMMPLARVTDMKYEQSPLGRLLNYGTFVIESAGQDQALRDLPHLPNPNDLYLQVVEEMYEPDAVEARLRTAREQEEDEVADA
jgi:membrane protein YdbS with pleckstrin-like domain